MLPLIGSNREFKFLCEGENLMRYQNFFWDFDGTLYDTYQIMPLAYYEAWGDEGYCVSQAEAYRMMRVGSLGQTFKYHQEKYDVSLAKLAEIKGKYEVSESNYFSKVKKFAGATEILKQVTDAGGQNFLLTHRSSGAIELLERDNLTQFISGSVTGQDSFPRKPDPLSLNYLLDKFAIERSTAVMVGDRSLDIEAGHNARIAGALFDPDGLMTEQKVNAELKVHSLKELNKYVGQ